ncbi:(2Fe-2S)-binding protein [Acidipropionibacterium timonense]|uniref:(2Fe-2S)-binding protein n=1 Tax=Acidipropionibacterium timonense TaxID=2161818 RepID=UPI0010325E01|nr:(2Fe-2S)-binding protein [Acidipropionibacterium timonense]
MDHVDLTAEGFDQWVATASHDPADTPVHPWRPLSTLLDPATLESRIAHTHASLTTQRHTGTAGHGRPSTARPGQVRRRVAVSAVHLGIVARLLVPVIAARSAGHPVRLPRPADMWWQGVPSAPIPLSIAWSARPHHSEPDHEPDLTDSAVAALTERFIDAGLTPLIAWDNLASAASTSVIMITRCRPDLAEPVRTVAQDVLELIDPRPDAHVGATFRRRACCLYWQVSGSRDACCGDCVLVAP